MKRRLLFGLLLAGLLVAGCNQQTPGPALTEEETQTSWQTFSNEASSLAQGIKQDPVIQTILGTLGLSSLDTSPLQALTATLNKQNLGDIFPLAVQELPRGGYDYTDPENPRNFTPQSPFDFQLKQIQNGHTFDLAVDWDKDGAHTIRAKTPNGDWLEVPQKAQAELKLDSQQAGEATLAASWYQCGDAYTFEPKKLDLDAWAGQNARLALRAKYNLSQSGGKETQNFETSLNAKTQDGKEGTVSVKFSITEAVQRDSQCFPVQATPEQITFEFEGRVPSKRVAFHLDARNIQTTSEGAFQSASVSGYGKVDGRVAFTFSGQLDDLDQPCPGAHVNLTFADRQTTLAAWMQAQGMCPSATP